MKHSTIRIYLVLGLVVAFIIVASTFLAFRTTPSLKPDTSEQPVYMNVTILGKGVDTPSESHLSVNTVNTTRGMFYIYPYLSTRMVINKTYRIETYGIRGNDTPIYKSSDRWITSATIVGE